MKKLETNNDEDISVLKDIGHKTNNDVGSIDISTDFINRIIYERKGSGDFKVNEVIESGTYDDKGVASGQIHESIISSCNKNRKKNLHVSFYDEKNSDEHCGSDGNKATISSEENVNSLIGKRKITCRANSEEDLRYRSLKKRSKSLKKTNQELCGQLLHRPLTEDDFESYGENYDVKNNLGLTEYLVDFADDTCKEGNNLCYTNSTKSNRFKPNVSTVFQFTEDVLESCDNFNCSYVEKCPDKIGRFTLIAVKSNDETLNITETQNNIDILMTDSNYDSIKEENSSFCESEKDKCRSNSNGELNKSNEGYVDVKPRISTSNSDELKWISHCNYLEACVKKCEDDKHLIENKLALINTDTQETGSIDSISHKKTSVEMDNEFLNDMQTISKTKFLQAEMLFEGKSEHNTDYGCETNIDNELISEPKTPISTYDNNLAVDETNTDTTLNECNSDQSNEFENDESLESCVKNLLKDIRDFNKSKNRLFDSDAAAENGDSNSRESVHVSRNSSEIKINRDEIIGDSNNQGNTNFDTDINEFELAKYEALYNNLMESNNNLEISTKQKYPLSLTSSETDDATFEDAVDYTKIESEVLNGEKDREASNALASEPHVPLNVKEEEAASKKELSSQISVDQTNQDSSSTLPDVLKGSFKYSIKKITKESLSLDAKNNSIRIPWNEIFPVHKVQLHYPQRGIWWSSIALINSSRRIPEK